MTNPTIYLGELPMTAVARKTKRELSWLRLQAVNVSPHGARRVRLRHDLEICYKRLMHLAAQAQDDTFVLSGEQVHLLARHSCEYRMRHIEANTPGEVLNQDAFYWDTLKGLGKIYVQIVSDYFCSLVFAKEYTSGPAP